MKSVDEFFEEMEERFYGVDVETVRSAMRMDSGHMLEIFEGIASFENNGVEDILDILRLKNGMEGLRVPEGGDNEGKTIEEIRWERIVKIEKYRERNREYRRVKGRDELDKRLRKAREEVERRKEERSRLAREGRIRECEKRRWVYLRSEIEDGVIVKREVVTRTWEGVKEDVFNRWKMGVSVERLADFLELSVSDTRWLLEDMSKSSGGGEKWEGV
jgi:hypothetical protein